MKRLLFIICLLNLMAIGCASKVCVTASVPETKVDFKRTTIPLYYPKLRFQHPETR